MEMPLDMAWMSLQLGRGRVSGSHQGGIYTVSRVDGNSDMVLDCQFYSREGSSEEQWLLSALLLGENCSSSSHPDFRRISSC